MTTTPQWIEAIAACVAAVGTVAAVAFALWQNARRETRRLHLESSFVLSSAGGRNAVQLIVSNDGYRSVTIRFPPTILVERRDGTRVAITAELIPELSTPLPVTLAVDGEPAFFRWLPSSLDPTEGAPLEFSFLDVTGNRYRHAYPGVQMGWTLRGRFPWLFRDYRKPEVFMRLADHPPEPSLPPAAE